MPHEIKESPLLPFSWNKFQGVVLFGDLAGFFPIVRKMELDKLSQFIGKFYSMCHSEVTRHNGEVVSYIGDAIFAIFKRECCNGKDPEWCATLSAFRMIKQMRKIDPEIVLNFGVDSGEMIEGTWETAGKSTRTVLGDTVNRAAILAGGKLTGIHSTRQITQVLGPRVKHEKVEAVFPGTQTEEPIYKLLSLDL